MTLGKSVIVPVEPTREMLNAAIDVDSFKLGNISPLGFRISPQMLFEKCWSAMLAAAPAPSSLAGGEVSPLVRRLAYGYAIMNSAICNMAGTSGADGRWYYDKANEAFRRVSPIHSITEDSNPHVNGDYFSGLSSFLAALSPEAPAREWGEIGEEFDNAAHCVTLADCPPGLFLWNGSLGFKSEYGAMEPVGISPHHQQWKVGNRADAYCADSGEYFWGGTSTHEDRAKVLVYPIDARTVAMVASHGPAALTPRHEAQEVDR